MGKKKENLEDLKRDDPKDNNWEIPPAPDPVPVKRPEFDLNSFRHHGGCTTYLIDFMEAILTEKVDPAFWDGNPVDHWSVADDHVTYVFHDGRKHTVILR